MLCEREEGAGRAMDLKGQKLCEALASYLLIASAVLAFAAGLYTQSIR